MTAEAFGSLRLPVRSVIVTENLVNFLALPERPGTLAIYGGGYGFSSLRDAGWLKECEVLYWGDLDTHGFRILDQLRAVHPHVASVLMDQETLLAHRDAWGHEPSPSRAALTRLTPEERALYERWVTTLWRSRQTGAGTDPMGLGAGAARQLNLSTQKIQESARQALRTMQQTSRRR